MNIWIFNHYADPPDGQATRTYDLSKKLVERGHKVTVFAAAFSHYSFKDERLRQGETAREQEFNGVRFIWLRTFPYVRNDWRRVLNMVTYGLGSVWRGLRLSEKPDVILGVSVHPLAALSGWMLSLVKRCRFYLEVTDLWPQVLVEFGRLSESSVLAKVLRQLERFLYRRATRIIMIWPRTGEYLERFGIAAEKIVWIPHIADLNRYTSLKTYDGKIHETFTVMYLGSFNDSTGMWVIPECARLLQARGVHQVRFKLVGGGVGGDALLQSCKDKGVTTVEFRKLVAKQKIAATMSEADSFIVTLKNVPLLKYGISLNKLCDYLSSGRPTIMAGEPGYNPVLEAQAGISVPAEDPAALADAIEQLIALSPQERIVMGKSGREYIERMHSVDLLADRFERTFSSNSEPSIEVSSSRETEAGLVS